MENKVSKFVFWAPRVLSIIFIVFLALFSLDVFGTGLNFWQTVGAFLLHNIPAFVLIVVLVIAWKREIVGGIVFILAGLAYVVMTFNNVDDWRLALAWSVEIAGVAFLIGGLFLTNWIQKRK